MSKTRTITPNPPADFMEHQNIRPFRAWCQKVLPLVYDDSLSYYELLCKVLDSLNKTIIEVDDLGDAYDKLEDYVNHYFDNLDVQEEINKKLDELVESGKLDILFDKYVPYVTLREFGAIEGEDCYTAFINAINNKNSKKIIVIDGDYLISKGITLNKSILILGGMHTLKCSEPMDYVFYITSDAGDDVTKWTNLTIDSLSINCDKKATTGIKIGKNYNSLFKNIKINSPIANGVITGSDKNGASILESVVVDGMGCEYGFYDEYYDNIYKGCSSIDCKVGFRTTNGKYENCTSWISDKNFYAGSVGYVVSLSQPTFVNCNVDTLEKGFVIGEYNGCSILGLTAIFNEAVVKISELLTKPCCIYFNNDNKNCRANIFGFVNNIRSPFNFSNVDFRLLKDSHVYGVINTTDTKITNIYDSSNPPKTNYAISNTIVTVLANVESTINMVQNTWYDVSSFLSIPRPSKNANLMCRNVTKSTSFIITVNNENDSTTIRFEGENSIDVGDTLNISGSYF